MRRGALCRAFTLVLVLFPGLDACSTTCDGSGAVVRYTDGTTNAASTYYETSGSDEPFLDFPSGRQLELVHGLSRTADVVSVYVAFDRKPTSFTQAAGNQALIQLDPEVIRVKNDTCTDFYVRVEAWLADTAPSDAGSSDGG
jgi:hypothetical protein